METSLPRLNDAFETASAEILAAILDQSADCIKVIGPEGTVDYMNRNGQCAMEIDDFCAVSGQQWPSLWPAESRHLIDEAIATARSGKVARLEAFCPTAKGSPRWWDVSVSPLRRPDGGIDGYIATSRDITERVNQQRLREAVSDEMRHRLRNNYVVVGSLLSAYARGKPEHEEFAREMTRRLTGLGVAQTMKAEQGADCDLASLVAALLEPYATPDCPLIIGALPDALLDQSGVDALALVLGELACNSTKHGALGATGRVEISGTRDGDLVRLVWSERSDRAVAAHERDGGQGLRLMKRVLASQRGGIDLNWADDGLDAEVTIAAH